MTVSSARAAPPLEPAWRPWVRLLDAALEAAADPAWANAAPEPSGGAPDGRAGAPLLHGAVVRPDPRRVRRLTRELLRIAAEATADAGGAPAAKPRTRRLDAMALLRAAVAQDAEAVARIAGPAGVDADALGVVAQLAAMPLLQACAARLRDRVPDDWLRGYCPICGAWPSLAELRGIERNRHLRCGRCGGDWVMPVLHCPFCNEVRHDRLGALLPEGEEQRRRVDTCETCKGYVKTLSTLRPLAPRALAMEDLETVELDLVAHERGYARPERPGFAVEMTLERGAGGAERGARGAPPESEDRAASPEEQHPNRATQTDPSRPAPTRPHAGTRPRLA